MSSKAMETARTRGVAGSQQEGQRAMRLPRRAKLTTAAIIAVAGTGLLVAACGSSPSSSASAPAASAPATPAASAPASGPASAAASPAAAASAVLKTEKSSLGTVLTNSKGLTVYWFAADHGDTSACTGACAAAWPPVTGTPVVASGVSLPGTLGTITRAGGVKQATYNGHPLYTFAADTAPGQVNGNGVDGFGAYWYAITIGASDTATTAPTSGSGGGGW